MRSGTSPPMEHWPWSVTLSARMVAAAASAALPPPSRRAIPAATAAAPPAATAPVLLVAFQPIDETLISCICILPVSSLLERWLRLLGSDLLSAEMRHHLGCEQFHIPLDLL